MQPARLALGIRERLLGAGVEIFENSPVRELREGDDGVLVRTRRRLASGRRARR